MKKPVYPVIDMKNTGKKLKWLKEAHKLTSREIADYLGFTSKRAIYRWFQGESLPTVDNLFALSKLFGVSMDEMIVEKK